MRFRELALPGLLALSCAHPSPAKTPQETPAPVMASRPTFSAQATPHARVKSSPPPATGKKADCHRLVSCINDAAEQMKAATDQYITSKKTPTDNEAFARGIERLAREPMQIVIEDEILKAEALKYHRMLIRLAGAARNAKSTDIKIATAALSELNSIDGVETAIVHRINDYCDSEPSASSGFPASCIELG